MRVLILIPTYYSDYNQTDVYFPTPPLGPAYIAACLEKSGHEAKIFDTLGRNNLIRPTIEKFKPDMIAIQCYTTGFAEFKRVVYEIRTYYQGLLVAGGPHITAMEPHEMPDDYPIDYFIRKEAEKAMVQIADGWLPSNRVIDGEMVDDLDELPFPSRHLIEFGQYVNEPRTSIIASRGCPYSCTFCFDSHQWRKVRLRKPDAVVEEMKRVNAVFGFKRFFFTDDTFILNPNRTKEFADLLEGTGFLISCNGRCNTLNEEIMKDLVRMNVENLYVGVESGNQRLLNVMKKGITTEQIIKTHELAKKYKIKMTSFMLMSIPTQTIQEMHDDFRFAAMLVKKYKAILDYSILYTYPNTPVYYEAKKNNPAYDIKDWSVFRHTWRYPTVPIYVEQGHNIDQLISLYKNFRFKIDRMQIPIHKLPMAAARHVTRRVYRKTRSIINKDYVFGVK